MAIRVEQLDRAGHPHRGCPECDHEAVPAPSRDRLRLVPNPAPGEGSGTKPAGPIAAPGRPSARRLLVRRTLAALLVVTVAGTAAAILRSDPTAVSAVPEPPHAGETLVLAPGETLWEALAPHTPAGTSRHDFVARVLDANGIDGQALPPGRVVRLPAP